MPFLTLVMANQQDQDSHIVPKVYLKKFVKQNGKLFKLRKDVKKYPKPTDIHPSGICYKKGFYKFSGSQILQGYTVTDVNILEKRGFLYENRLGKLVDKVIKPTETLLMREVADLSEMLFDIKGRNEYMREHGYSKHSINASIDNIIAEQERNREQIEPILQEGGMSFGRLRELTEGLRQEWTNNDIYSKELHNRSLLENKINPGETSQIVCNKLARGQWIIFETTINQQFITSDNPGFCADQHERIYNTRFAGICSFYFPLTPYYFLVIMMEGDTIRALPNQSNVIRRYANAELVKIINQATFKMANKEVYAAYEQPLLKTWFSLNSTLIV
jgi:hypothetical protein